MIDPHNITSFTRTDAELEELLLNAIAFAGKSAKQQAEKMHALFSKGKGSPFAKIRTWQKNKVLLKKLVGVKIGKYKLLAKSFSELANSRINLRACTAEDLVRFPGIGEKTARLFILHSRKGQKYAVIDTHVLKEMRLLKMTGLKATPSGKKYLELEEKFVAHLEKNGITDFAAYDLGIWKKYTRSK
jgi:endonuclease III